MPTDDAASESGDDALLSPLWRRLLLALSLMVLAGVLLVLFFGFAGQTVEKKFATAESAVNENVSFNSPGKKAPNSNHLPLVA